MSWALPQTVRGQPFASTAPGAGRRFAPFGTDLPVRLVRRPCFRDLIARLAEQAAPYAPRYIFGEEARFLDYAAGQPVVTTSSGLRVRARFIVVAGGIGTFTPRPLPALAGFEDRGLAYFVPEPEEYRDRDMVIVGGGDSAFDWALTLSPVARSVTMVHRLVAFRAHEGLVRPDPSLIVDVGSGPGAFLAVMLQEFPSARGIWTDASEAMLGLARDRLAEFGDRVEFRIADMTDLAGAAAGTDAGGFPSADVITTSRAVHHLDRAGLFGFYQQAASLLNPGGWLINLDHIGPAGPGGRVGQAAAGGAQTVRRRPRRPSTTTPTR